MDFLRDPIWQSIGAILAFVAIGISLYTFWYSRSIKRLAYEVVSVSSMLTISDTVKDVSLPRKIEPVEVRMFR